MFTTAHDPLDRTLLLVMIQNVKMKFQSSAYKYNGFEWITFENILFKLS